MKKKRISLLRGIAVCVNAAAAAVLAVGFVAGMRAGYGSETWKEILGGKNYVETAEFQEQAASSVYDALEAAVRGWKRMVSMIPRELSGSEII